MPELGRYHFQQCREVLFGYAVLLRFVINIKEKNYFIGYHNMNDHPGATAFALALRSNSNSYLKAVVTDWRPVRDLAPSY